MKFLIVGLGSMGKRRIRNLLYLKAGRSSVSTHEKTGRKMQRKNTISRLSQTLKRPWAKIQTQ